MTPDQLYKQYNELYPAAKDEYNPTAENVRKWRNAIEAKRKVGNLARYERDITGIEQLRAERGAKMYEGMAQNARKVYQALKEQYIGTNIFACGSRVRGDYVDMWDMEGSNVRRARIAAGMPDKKESDFDFWLSGNYETKQGVPPICDRVRCMVPLNEMIMLPEWDFSKLPANEHERVAQLIHNETWRDLLHVHDKYQLSPYSYCCDLEGFKKWWRYAIDTGKISTGAQGQQTAEGG